MTLTTNQRDSQLALSLTPALILDLAEDRIISANDAAARLFGTSDLAGLRFAPFLDGSVAAVRLFFEEVLYRGTAWTRTIPLQTIKGEAWLNGSGLR